MTAMIERKYQKLYVEQLESYKELLSRHHDDLVSYNKMMGRLIVSTKALEYVVCNLDKIEDDVSKKIWGYILEMGEEEGEPTCYWSDDDENE